MICPFCRDALRLDDWLLWQCPSCATFHHLACARENGRCTVLGCAGKPRFVIRLDRARGLRWPLHLVVEAGAVAALLFVTASAFGDIVTPEMMRRSRAHVGVRAIGQAIHLYAVENGRAPDSLDDLFRGERFIASSDELEDPWGTRYLYLAPRDGKPFDVVSLGADQAPGGVGDGADIHLRDEIEVVR